MATLLSTLRGRLRQRLLETYALPSPGSPVLSPQGTPGASTISYRLTASNAQGESLPSPAATLATAAATLTGSNYVQLTWTQVPGATLYTIYRTATNGTSPTTLGVIGTTANLTFNDTGLAGDSAAVPTVNTSGMLTPFWTEDELTDYLIDGAKDLWRKLVDLHMGHFTTIDIENVSLAANDTELTGVPADVHRIESIELRDTTESNTSRSMVFKPSKYKSRLFESMRTLSAQDPNNVGVILYDVLNAGSPVAAPTIVVGPPITADIDLRLTYTHTLPALTESSNNPIPGESDNALISWAFAYARSKERDDRMPDPAWIAVYATEALNLMAALTPRQEQEEEVVEDMFSYYWD